MQTEKLRGLFADFIKESGIREGISCNSCITIGQDETLKYERIDKYTVLFLTWQELKKLLNFCNKHGMTLWFGADKLCIGFNYRGNMRLSAYDSVPSGASCSEMATDIINSVRGPCAADLAREDRTEPDHHLDVYGGLD